MVQKFDFFQPDPNSSLAKNVHTKSTLNLKKFAATCDHHILGWI